MAINQRTDISEVSLSAQQEIAAIAGLPHVRAALAWFRAQENQFTQWQLEMSRIPAPPFGESARAETLMREHAYVGLRYATLFGLESPPLPPARAGSVAATTTRRSGKA